MIEPIGTRQNVSSSAQEKRYRVSADVLRTMRDSHDRVISHNVFSDTRIFLDKFANAFTIYPAKGLTGSKNSNFYEFLTMGMVPYTIGSLVMMWLFKGDSKFVKPSLQSHPNLIGKRMALGVLFYGLAKCMSKSLVETPVRLATGVDVNLPYKRVVYELPEYKGDKDIKSVEYHRVFESVDFPYWDLLYYHKSKKRNAYFDRIAEKMGLGENLNDSDQEVKPRIKQVVVRTKAAASLSSFLWAGIGVGLAMQSGWEELFQFPQEHNVKVFSWEFLSKTVKTFENASKAFWDGGELNYKSNKIAARVLFIAALTSSIGGAIFACSGLRKNIVIPKLSEIDHKKSYIES